MRQQRIPTHQAVDASGALGRKGGAFIVARLHQALGVAQLVGADALLSTRAAHEVVGVAGVTGQGLSAVAAGRPGHHQEQVAGSPSRTRRPFPVARRGPARRPVASGRDGAARHGSPVPPLQRRAKHPRPPCSDVCDDLTPWTVGHHRDRHPSFDTGNDPWDIGGRVRWDRTLCLDTSECADSSRLRTDIRPACRGAAWPLP